MRISIRDAVCSCLLGTTLALAVTLPAPADPRVPPTAENDCAFFRSVYDWRVLDDRNLIVWAPSRVPYQVTLSFPVRELRFAHSLAFVDDNNDGRLCGFGMDAVIVPNATPERVSISGMRRLDEEQLASLLDGHAHTPDERHDAAGSDQAS